MKKVIPWVVVVLLIAALAGVAYFAIFRNDIGVTGVDSDGIEDIRPINMKITNIRKDSFVVEWQTRTAVVGYLKYGDTSTSISLIVQEEQGSEPAKKHKARVGGLIPGRKYYFWVISDNVAFGRDSRALEVLTLAE